MENHSLAAAEKRPPLSLPFYYGWLVIGLCFVTTLTSAGVRSSPSVLIHPLEAEFGWSRTLIASAVSMNLLLFGIAAPVSGWLLDRYGPRKVMLGSLGLLVLGVTGTVAMDRFWQFFIVWGVIVGLGAGGVGSVLAATVGNRWFVAKRGLALGVLGSASSTGQLIFIPLFMAAITYAGWRLGSMVLIAVALVLLPMIYLWMRDDPSEVGLEPYGAGDPLAVKSGGTASLRGMPAKGATVTAREVLRHPTFWLLCGSFFICGGTANGLIGTHLIPHEIEIGIPQVAAASIVGVMGSLNLVGTIFSGWMIDRVQPQRWLALVYALRGVSLLLLPFVRDFSGLVVFAVIYGLDWFATVPPSMAITADTFGKQNVGKVYGWIFMSHQIGAAAMASAAGAVRDLIGDYHFAFLSGGVIAMIAAGLALQIRSKARDAEAAPAAPMPAGA
ncbi:MAG TPA: MFS transporter [candidate division Zixibacteria bacterium]|nr:MFS transporter [candidate division Zixibacteria bacterium]